MTAAREAWFEAQPEFDPDRLVFLNEMSAATNMAGATAGHHAVSTAELPPSNCIQCWLHLSSDNLARVARAEPTMRMVFVVVGDLGADPSQNGVGVGRGCTRA